MVKDCLEFCRLKSKALKCPDSHRETKRKQNKVTDAGNIMITDCFVAAELVLLTPQFVAPRNGVGEKVVRYLCTRPLASPFIKSFTSFSVAWLKSPGMVCFNADAATPNSAASFIAIPVTSP